MIKLEDLCSDISRILLISIKGISLYPAEVNHILHYCNQQDISCDYLSRIRGVKTGKKSTFIYLGSKHLSQNPLKKFWLRKSHYACWVAC